MISFDVAMASVYSDSYLFFFSYYFEFFCFLCIGESFAAILAITVDSSSSFYDTIWTIFEFFFSFFFFFAFLCIVSMQVTKKTGATR